MCPEKGVNAAFILFKFLKTITDEDLVLFMNKYLTDDPFGEKGGFKCFKEGMGNLTENVGIVKIEKGEVFIGIDFRIPSDEDVLRVEDNLKNILKDTSTITSCDFEASSFISEGKTKYVHYVDEKSELVQALLKSYSSVTGDTKNKAYTIGGGTYAKGLKNVVAFGPQFVGSEDVDHQADEYINIEDYKKVIAIYVMAIYELTK